MSIKDIFQFSHVRKTSNSPDMIPQIQEKGYGHVNR